MTSGVPIVTLDAEPIHPRESARSSLSRWDFPAFS